MKLEQLALTCASKADLLADLADHFTSLGLTLPSITFSLPDHPSGIAEFAMSDGTRVLISVQEMPAPRPLAANFVIQGEHAALWRERFHVPLAAAGEAVIQATRGDLTVPATARGTGTVRPRTPRHGFAGIAPLPPLETDFEEPEEWVQRQPGVASGYWLGEVVAKDGKRWLQTLDLPESAPGALNGGNYSVPGAGPNGWITQFADAEPTWEAGTNYQQPIVVRWPNNGTNGPVHRYQLQTATETAIAGREPHHAYMWAVWQDLGAA